MDLILFSLLKWGFLSVNGVINGCNAHLETLFSQNHLKKNKYIEASAKYHICRKKQEFHKMWNYKSITNSDNNFTLHRIKHILENKNKAIQLILSDFNGL